MVLPSQRTENPQVRTRRPWRMVRHGGNLLYPRYARNYVLSLILQGMISLVEWAVPDEFVRDCAMHSAGSRKNKNRGRFMQLLRKLWLDQDGQDIAEYAVMLAVILVIVVGTIRLIGSNANTVFSSVASSIQ